jgi:hypothetical protein
MALGKIKADTIEHSTAGSLDTQYVVNGSAKAWSNYSGSGTAFRDSFNHSSATDHGTGQYTVTLTNNMSNTNYSYTASSTDGGGGRSSVFSPLDFDNYLTSSMRGINNDTGNATEDTECVSSTFNGDLA